MRILVLNSGSSSIRFRCLDVVEDSGGGHRPGSVVFQGAVRGIGGDARLEWRDACGGSESSESRISEHGEAFRWIWRILSVSKIGTGGTKGRFLPDAVGHRVVHGGERFRSPVPVDERVEAEIEALSALAPLHNPPCLAGIRESRAFFGPHVRMVAVFDTSFHRFLLPEARSYPIPRELAERHGIRRYGFHGIAHASLVEGFASAVGRPASALRLLTLQLGNGCSAAAVRYGVSVETSMGFTPLEGLMMGTRCGDVDPAVVAYLSEREGVPPGEVEDWLNHRSGLLGVSGRTNDMRLLLAAREEGDERAGLAIDMFCFRVRKYIGAYLAVLGGADAVVFGGGIGEGSPEIRGRICEGMEWCGLRLSPERNRDTVCVPGGEAVRIGEDGSILPAYVVGGDEETRIALETVLCLRPDRPSS